MPPNTRYSSRSSNFSGNGNHVATTPVPILNTRMKNLSQFSFKYRENERPSPRHYQHQQQHLYEQSRRRTCRTCFQVSFFSILLLAIVLVLALVLSRKDFFFNLAIFFSEISNQRQITLRIVGFHFSSRLTATLNLCLIYLKLLVHVL